MKILYGVVGEGMGHATRSKVVVQYLLSRGHTVKIVASGRAYAFLKNSFLDVVEIRGLELKYVDGEVDLDGSVARNLAATPEMLARNLAVYRDVYRFHPDVAVSDFESFAHLFAKLHGIPVISIDNIQMISRCLHAPDVTGGFVDDFRTADAFVRVKLPRCEHYVVTTFFWPEIRQECRGNTTLVPPILRDAILAATPTRGGHTLVYQTDVGSAGLIDALNACAGRRFVVYGLRRDEIRGNCVIKNFSEDGFVRDLASADAVIANGGMSLLGEALYLGKPVYSVPIRRHPEQTMNACYLAKLGYGVACSGLDPASIEAFLRDVPYFAGKIADAPRQRGNEFLYQTIDRLLDGLSRGC